MERPLETYTDSFGQTIEFIIPDPHKKICINIHSNIALSAPPEMLMQICLCGSGTVKCIV